MLSLDSSSSRTAGLTNTGGTQITVKEWDHSNSGIRAWQVRGNKKSWFTFITYSATAGDYWWAIAKGERGAATTSVVDLTSTGDIQDKYEDKKLLGYAWRPMTLSQEQVAKSAPGYGSLLFRFPTVTLQKDESLFLLHLPNATQSGNVFRIFYYKMWYRGVT